MKKKWLWEFKRQMDTLRVSLFAASYNDLKIPFFYYNIKGETNFYWDKYIAEEKSNKLLKLLMANPKSLQKKFDKIEKYLSEFDKKINTLKEIDIKILSDKELYKLYIDYCNTFKGGGFGAVFIRTFIYKTEPYLKEYLDRKYKDKSNEVFNLLISSNKISFTQEEELSFLKILLFKKKNKYKINSTELRKQIDNHLSKYAYLTCGYFNEAPIQINDVYKRISESQKLITAEIKKKINNINNTNIKERERYVYENKKINELIKYIALSTEYKEEIRGKINEITFYSYPVFKEISRRTILSFKDLTYLLPEELKQSFFFNKNHHKIISNRKKRFFVTNGIKNVSVYNNNEALKKFKVYSKNIISFSNNEITGICANPGVITGNVKNISGPKETIRKGDILVTSMTTPEYIQQIKKASAIITDEGGITCHAAIVAREMKKPCIIGTKNATEVLKDGDMVEVDADKGVITKI